MRKMRLPIHEILRRTFSWKDPATHEQMELTNVISRAKVTETTE